MQCDTCNVAAAVHECGQCGHFRFCSVECGDALADHHHSVCYDNVSEDTSYLAALMEFCGLGRVSDVRQ